MLMSGWGYGMDGNEDTDVYCLFYAKGFFSCFPFSARYNEVARVSQIKQ